MPASAQLPRPLPCGIVSLLTDLFFAFCISILFILFTLGAVFVYLNIVIALISDAFEVRA